MNILINLLHILGFFIIWVAIDINRPNDKIKFGSRHWWLIVVLTIIGAYFLQTDKL